MPVDDRGVRPLAQREHRALDALQRGLDADPGLRASLRHGIPANRVPRRGLLAVSLGLGCVAITTTALACGPGYAMGVAGTGVLVLLTVMARMARHR